MTAAPLSCAAGVGAGAVLAVRAVLAVLAGVAGEAPAGSWSPYLARSSPKYTDPVTATCSLQKHGSVRAHGSHWEKLATEEGRTGTQREIERLEEMGGRKRGEGRETSPMLLTLSLTGLRPKLFEDSRPGNDYCLPTLTGLVALVTLTAGLRAVITRLSGRGSSRPSEFQPTTLTQTHTRTKEAHGLGRGHKNTSTHRNPPDRLAQR